MNHKAWTYLKKDNMRLATLKDLDFLYALEHQAFESYRASSKDMLKRSILSDQQMVVIIENEKHEPVGSMILKIYTKSIRIYSIAVYQSEKGKGYGQALMDVAIHIAYEIHASSLYLEVDASDKSLIQWYEMLGFGQREFLENYYEEGKHGIKMVLEAAKANCMVVTDYDTDFFDHIPNVIHTRANDYIENESTKYSKSMKVYNMCLNHNYQSIGYYVSLLALARKQVVYPSTSMIRDINNKRVLQSIGEEIENLIQKTFKDETKNQVILYSYFGQSNEEKYQHLIKQMNQLYHSPLLKFAFERDKEWVLSHIEIRSLMDLSKEEKDMVKPWLVTYFSSHTYGKGALKNYDYDLAILVDPNEVTPPSDKKALDAFVRAGEKKGFSVSFITEKDYNRITEFDALFIRTTTSVNNYTYDFSRLAYAEGLVVMDDPWSILRCANKIYLYDALKKANINMPKSWVFNKKNLKRDLFKKLPYPIVLKLPDSAFSAHVYKVSNPYELEDKLKVMFEDSELIIGQAFVASDFDWRIGVLDGKFLFACQYFMAKDDWKILSWSEEGILEGDYKTFSKQQVPDKVLKVALQAANTIGDGLYGVDIKEVNDKVYVIEINDNPNIEYGVEDDIERDDLYDHVMEVFYNRLEDTMKIIRPIS